MSFSNFGGAEFLTLWGLVIDVMGVAVLWKWGLPTLAGGSGVIFNPEGDSSSIEEKIAIHNVYEVHTNAGIVMIVLGFVLQAFATLI